MCGPSGTNGIELLLGDGRQIKLTDQEEAAIGYLKAHREELKALVQFPGVDTCVLGLVWICKPEQLGFCVGPSFELMQLALDIGKECHRRFVVGDYFGSAYSDIS